MPRGRKMVPLTGMRAKASGAPRRRGAWVQSKPAVNFN
jgi:hypothetical protein